MCIYGRPSHREVLEMALEWATPMERGFDYMRQQEAAAAAKAKGKGKARETGVGGSGGGVGDGMQQILDRLVKVNEDEKAADGVMVSSFRTLADFRRHSRPTWMSPSCRCTLGHHRACQASSSSTSCRTSRRR